MSPGGWFESQEVEGLLGCDDGTLSVNGPLATWVRELAAASEQCERPISGGSSLKGWLEEVGFVDVHQRVFKMPSNGWAKDERLKGLGRMWERNFAAGMSGFSVMLFNRAFGRSAQETEVSNSLVRNACDY